MFFSPRRVRKFPKIFRCSSSYKSSRLRPFYRIKRKIVWAKIWTSKALPTHRSAWHVCIPNRMFVIMDIPGHNRLKSEKLYKQYEIYPCWWWTYFESRIWGLFPGLAVWAAWPDGFSYRFTLRHHASASARGVTFFGKIRTQSLNKSYERIFIHKINMMFLQQ